MTSSLSPMSARLNDLVHRSGLRNFRATALHYDAAGLSDAIGGGPARVELAYERYVRGMIESGICWRDPNAGRTPA